MVFSWRYYSDLSPDCNCIPTVYLNPKNYQVKLHFSRFLWQVMELHLRRFCVKVSQEFLIFNSNGRTLLFGKTPKFIFVPTKNMMSNGVVSAAISYTVVPNHYSGTKSAPTAFIRCSPKKSNSMWKVGLLFQIRDLFSTHWWPITGKIQIWFPIVLNGLYWKHLRLHWFNHILKIVRDIHKWRHAIRGRG